MYVVGLLRLRVDGGMRFVRSRLVFFFFLLGDGRSQILKLELRHCGSGYGQTRCLNLDDGARASR